MNRSSACQRGATPTKVSPKIGCLQVGSMEYKESDVLVEEDSGDGHNEAELSPDILEIEDDELDTWPEELALDALNKKSKISPVRFSLEKRRAIEDYLEQRRLREEFDYELDTEASENNDVTKSE